MLRFWHLQTQWSVRKELPLAKVKTIWEDSWLMNTNRC
jgi:hypothetical protein